MKPFIISVLKQYWLACDVLAQNFATKYFGKAGNIDQWWVASDVGGIYFINDYFFDMHEMADFVNFKYTRKEMFEYKDKQLESYENKKGTMICIRDWKRINKMKLK